MESNDFDPGPWKGHDFKSARSTYDAHAGRSYANAVASNKGKKELIEPQIIFQSSAPLAIVSDITGSMGEDPKIFFSKLGYLDLEGQEYLGQDMEICFGATGDAYCDNYPFQIRKPVSGQAMKQALEDIIKEKGGGGQQMETYELFALYFARLVQTPNAIRKPILILIGDEAPYPFVNEDQAEDLLGITLNERLSTKAIFEELKKTWSVYLIRRPYNGAVETDVMSAASAKIYYQWVELLGEDHITTLPNADRVVDIIFGILAQETGRVDYFKDEVTQRQLKDEDGPEKIAIVFKALETIHTSGEDDSVKQLGGPGRSVTRRKSKNIAKTGEKLI